uniref:DUF3715 domain-containing protein n=2 Tax=Plectus sambesii TaxID=2011161 RepID=A0A914WY28_9BILA
MSAMTYSSSFVIPRKKKADTDGVKRVREVAADSREFTESIAPIFKQSFYNQQLKDFVRLSKCLIVDNKELSAKLEARRKALRVRGYQEVHLNYSYAFLHVTKDEIDQICEEGLSAGNSIDGSLGDAAQGIYLCKHADLTTPAPPAANCEEIIVVFRILKGRSKQVGLHSSDLDPDYTFDSHIAKPMATTSNTKVSRIDLYHQNRIYLYEYGTDSMDVVDTPSCACPIAVVYCQFPEELRWFAGHNPWRGVLSIGPTSFAASLSSHYATLKIHDLGQSLEVTTIVPWEQCAAYQPFVELIASDHAAAIAKRREVVLTKGLNAGLRASYWTISSSDKDFPSFYDNMKSSRVAGIGCLPGGTNLIVMPTGELSALLGLPNFSDRSLHCVVVSYRSVTLGINFSANDVLDKREVMFRQPTLVEQVDGVSERVVEAFKESFLQWQHMEQQAVMAQLDEAVATAELYQNPVTAMKDPRVRMRLSKIGNGINDIAASSTTFRSAADGDASSVSTHFSDKAAFGAAVDAQTERSYEESSNQSDNDALVVDDEAEDTGDEDGATSSSQQRGENAARQKEKMCAPLFSEDSSLCLQLDEALSEVSYVAQTEETVKPPPKKKVKLNQTLPTTNATKIPRMTENDGIRKCIDELKAINQSPIVDSASNGSFDDFDTPQSPPPQEVTSPAKPLIIAFDSGDADDTQDTDQVSSSVTSTSERRSRRKVYDWLLDAGQEFDRPLSPVKSYDEDMNNHINTDDIGYYAQKTGSKAMLSREEDIDDAIDEAYKNALDDLGDICQNNYQTVCIADDASDLVLDLELDYDESEMLNFDNEENSNDGVMLNYNDDRNSLIMMEMEPEKDMLLHAFNAITESVVKELQTKRVDCAATAADASACAASQSATVAAATAEVSPIGLKVSATLTELRKDFDRRATRVAAGRVGARPIGPLGKAGRRHRKAVNKALKTVWHNFQTQLEPFRPSSRERHSEAIDALFEVQETLLARDLGLPANRLLHPPSSQGKCSVSPTERSQHEQQQHFGMQPQTDDVAQKVELIVNAKPNRLHRPLRFANVNGAGCKQLDDLLSSAADVFALAV